MTSMQSCRRAKSHQCCQSHGKGNQAPNIYGWQRSFPWAQQAIWYPSAPEIPPEYTPQSLPQQSPRAELSPGSGCVLQPEAAERQAGAGLPATVGAESAAAVRAAGRGSALPAAPFCASTDAQQPVPRWRMVTGDEQPCWVSRTWRDHSLPLTPQFTSVSCINFSQTGTPTFLEKKPAWNAEQQHKVCNGPVARGTPSDIAPICCLAMWVLSILVLSAHAYVYHESSCWHLIYWVSTNFRLLDDGLVLAKNVSLIHADWFMGGQPEQQKLHCKTGVWQHRAARSPARC